MKTTTEQTPPANPNHAKFTPANLRSLAIVAGELQQAIANLHALGFVYSAAENCWIGPASHLEEARKYGGQRVQAAEQTARPTTKAA